MSARLLKVILLCLSITICGFFSKAALSESGTYYSNFIWEAFLDSQGKLDAMRFLQARIVQPETGYYLVRNAKVLLTESDPMGVFSYLITFQSSRPKDGAFDLDDLYSVHGYYVALAIRSGETLRVLDEFAVTPPELIARLNIETLPPPPLITSDPEKLDYTGPLFDAMNPQVVEWRKTLVQQSLPRWEWIDMTGDGYLDFVLDIEGFEYQPTSYYSVIVSKPDGFIEGFYSWGFNADFMEQDIEDLGDFSADSPTKVIRADRYDVSEKGQWLPYWRDFYLWESDRFIPGNMRFASSYQELIKPLEQLAVESLDAENESEGRFSGLNRYAINAIRFSEGRAAPFVYYFNLARIFEYLRDMTKAREWYRKVIEYIDKEYDTKGLTRTTELSPNVQAILMDYEEWRDEYYIAAEAAIETG